MSTTTQRQTTTELIEKIDKAINEARTKGDNLRELVVDGEMAYALLGLTDATEAKYKDLPLRVLNVKGLHYASLTKVNENVDPIDLLTGIGKVAKHFSQVIDTLTDAIHAVETARAIAINESEELAAKFEASSAALIKAHNELMEAL